jgi:muramidase (phage lysozyme)
MINHPLIMLDNPNIKAFLTMIRCCEGTNYTNGYRYLFGSTHANEKLFDSFANHPGKYFTYTDKSGKILKTSAAGAYQITLTTWKALKKRVTLPNFDEHSQDLAALELINETGAIPYIEQGKIEKALDKVKKIWASLPGSGSNQPERNLAFALRCYRLAGGMMA